MNQINIGILGCVKIGVLGCANIAERFILPIIKDLPDRFTLIGIASRTKDKADGFSKKFNTEPYYSYEKLVYSKKIDAIYIPLPNSMHYDWVKKSLEEGLHVLVEKSLVCSLSENEELHIIAKNKKLVLIENFQFRFHSQLKYIQKLIGSNIIGELRGIRTSFCFPPFVDKNNIRYSQELGGGALLDAGAYTLKISQIFLEDDDVYVDSASLFYDNVRNVDIWGSAYLKQRNGKLTSQVIFGFDNFYQCSLELLGSKGRIYTNRIFTAPPEYEPIIEVETMEKKENIKLSPDNHFKNMLLYFYEQVNNQDKTDYEYEQNIKQSRLIQELREKANVK